MSGGTGPRRQRGIAAITAMLVVTIATMLAIELVWDLNLDVRRTQTLLLRDQAVQIALGAEVWVSDILRQDFEDDGGSGTDHLNEVWAQDIPPLPVEGGTVDGTVEDLQGRFNLNNLLDPQGRKDPLAVDQFRRLLRSLELDAELADAVVDWIDPDQVAELSGAEDDVYTSRTPPYRAANFWFTTTSELLAVSGIDGEVFRTLEPHVSALPVATGQAGALTRINVNTATGPVLRSLGDDVTDSTVEQWLEDRPFDDMDAFMEATQELLDPAIRPYLDVGTAYFRLTVITSIGTTRLSMYSLLERNAQGVVIARLRSFDAN